MHGLRDRKVWFFNCANTYSGNPKWLFEYVNRYRPEIDAYWICDSATTIEAVRKLGYQGYTFADPKGHAVQQRAGVFVVNQVKEEIPELLFGVTLLNLWHGVGVKSIERAMNQGYLEERIARKYIQNNKYYRDHQLFVVTSPTMEKHFTKQIGLDEETIIRAGYPQNAFPRRYGSNTVVTFDHERPGGKRLPAGARLALFAPTPRRDQSGAFLHAAFPDVPRLLGVLERENIVLIMKMHPHMTKDPTFELFTRRYADHPNLILWNNDDDIYELFPKIDLAIVDYSSILYDLLAAGVRNFIRYVFDLEGAGSEVLEPGFDYLSLSCGTVTDSFDSMLDALGQDNEVDPGEIGGLIETFWEYDSDESMESIVDRALEFTPRDVALPELHSFDVFDTVIHRDCVLPEGVFYRVRDQILSSGLGFPGYLQDRYVEIRQQAEAAAREFLRKREDRKQSGLLEIKFQDIFDQMAEVFGLSAAQVDALKRWEIAAELSAVIPDSETIRQIEELRATGATVILISDMYLPVEVVREMLTVAAPDLGDLPLFLSNETGEQKTTRKLYLRAYRELGYDFASWTHHGDNVKADVNQAEKLAITPERVQPTKLSRFEKELASTIGTYDGYLLAGLLRSCRLEGEDSPVERYALNHVSAYLVPYVDWAVNDAVKRGYRTLYFVSRDGYHLKRIADAIVGVRDLPLKTAYLYGSRTAWRFASQVDEVDPDLFQGHGDFAHVRSPGVLLSNARLSKSEFLGLLPEHSDIFASGDLDADRRQLIVSALGASEGYRDILLKRAAEEREIVVDYLRENMDLSEDFAVVEYWGRGYTQDCLRRILEVATGDEVATPFYYARSIYPTSGNSIRHNFTKANYSMLFIEAIFANLDHGTVEAYRRENSAVVPVFGRRQNDSLLHETLEQLLPQFARAYSATEFEDVDRVGRDLFRFGFEYYAKHPAAPVFVKNLAPLHDAVELGSAEREFAPALTLADIESLQQGLSLPTRSVPLSLERSTEKVRRAYAAAVRGPAKDKETASDHRAGSRPEENRLRRLVLRMRDRGRG